MDNPLNLFEAIQDGWDDDNMPGLAPGSDSDEDYDDLFGHYQWTTSQIVLQDLISSSDSDSAEDDAPIEGPRARTTFPGGRGTGRPLRQAPRAYLEDQDGNVVSRRHPGKGAPWWGRFFQSPLRPGSLQWDNFRTYFRTPKPLFDMILRDCRSDGRFSEEAPANGGHKPGPLELKIAAYLRWLSTGAQVNAFEDGSGLARSTLQKFFIPFGEWFLDHYYDEWIKLPSGPTAAEELARMERPFRECGLPGCVLSQDGVHVAWDRCPSIERFSHTGKESYPTLAWNVNVDHTTKIRSVHDHVRDEFPHDYDTWRGALKGAVNDKTHVRTDKCVATVRDDELYTEFEYEVYVDANGGKKLVKGGYILNDGGYHRWLHTIAGPKAELACSYVEEAWGSRCESIRKDTERTFGIMKRRFRILRLPSLLLRAKDIDTTFKVCAVLHNMLLQFDGLDTIGTLDSDYITQDEYTHDGNVDITIDNHLESTPTAAENNAEAMEADPRSSFTPFQQAVLRPLFTPVAPDSDYSLIGSQCPVPGAERVEEDDGYDAKRDMLMHHFKFMWDKKEVRWLKKASECRPKGARNPLGAPGPWNADAMN